jgi:hypothetical protein
VRERVRRGKRTGTEHIASITQTIEKGHGVGA